MKFKIGDVEAVNYTTPSILYIRLNYTEEQAKKLNNLFNANFNTNEWITIQVDPSVMKVEKIVCYSEEDNFEYNVSALFDKEELTDIIIEAIKILRK